MRIALALVFITAACGGTITSDGDGDNDSTPPPDACVGIECAVARCDQPGQTPTTLTGTVFAPNGTLPLYGADVYVPLNPPGALPEGAQCSQCAEDLPGGVVTRVTTDTNGNFTLTGVPSGATVPVVISIGKWRRQITVSNVTDCTSTALPATDTRLPKNKSEGDIPNIAITTGKADALECLVRKLGIEDSEITTNTGTGRIQLYKGNGVSKIGGQTMTDAQQLWNTVDELKKHDIVIFSCEGDQGADTKSQDAMNAVKAYADLGGRVFLSHWHNIWIEGSTQDDNRTQKPDQWPSVATWNDSGTTFGGGTDHDTIDEHANPKGMDFAKWMVAVMGTTQAAQDDILIGNDSGKQTCTAVDSLKAERWVYWQDNGTEYPQNFQFTTPVEAATDARCGKVVFSDMHVAGDSSSPENGTFPNSCSTGALTPQEKALAFMFFDIATCINVIGKHAPE